MRCIHVRDGIILTEEMDTIIVQLLKDIIWNLEDDTNAGKKFLGKCKTKLAENLMLAFFPGPTADVLVIAGPDDGCGQIDFNSMRYAAKNRKFSNNCIY